MVEMTSTSTGARGQKFDVQPYSCSKRGFFWALTAARKRKDVKPMIAQLVKKDALVMAMSQFRTSFPPAMVSGSVNCSLWDQVINGEHEPWTYRSNSCMSESQPGWQ